MGRRADGLGDIQGKRKVDRKVPLEQLDYHEGLSVNQVKVVLREFGLANTIRDFFKWMDGQTGPIIHRWNDRQRRVEAVCGTYEYDLFRWVAHQKTKAPLIWD